MVPAFVAVDWGTSNRRCFVCAADGRVISRSVDDLGILAVKDFATEVATLQAVAGAAPLLLAGMVGSNRGWHDVPYVMAPAGLADVAAGILRVEGAAIVPGVQFDDPVHPDIMRGEEVQLLGALALGQIADGLVCLPGTHSKWVEMEDGRIGRFRTVMTGDVFAALKARSILSDILQHAPDDDAAFIAGVDQMLANPDLTAALFTVRVRVVTGRITPAQAASQVSGLLIGADVRAGLGRMRADVVPIIGEPALCRRFGLALARAGRESLCIDGETAFVAGARALAASL